MATGSAGHHVDNGMEYNMTLNSERKIDAFLFPFLFLREEKFYFFLIKST